MSLSKRVYEEGSEPPADLKLYVCTDHDKHQTEAKVSSVVLAYSEERAIELLDEALIKAGLRPKGMWRYRLQSMPLDRAYAEVLNDGDY
jgi:hypothetical protein